MTEFSNENLKLIEQAGISLKGLNYKSSAPYKNGYIYIIENNDYEYAIYVDGELTKCHIISKKSKLLVEYTDNVICPYCGHEHDYCHKDGYTDFDYDCDSCGKEFSVEVDIQITYSTYVKD